MAQDNWNPPQSNIIQMQQTQPDHKESELSHTVQDTQVDLLQQFLLLEQDLWSESAYTLEHQQAFELHRIGGSIYPRTYTQYAESQKQKNQKAWSHAEYIQRLRSEDASFDMLCVMLESQPLQEVCTATPDQPQLMHTKKLLYQQTIQQQIDIYMPKLIELIPTHLQKKHSKRLQSFLENVLDPETDKVRIGEYEMVFNTKDLAIQKVNGQPISSLQEHTLWWDPLRWSQLLVPSYELDAQHTSPEIIQMMQQSNPNGLATNGNYRMAPSDVRYLPFLYFWTSVSEEEAAGFGAQDTKMQMTGALWSRLGIRNAEIFGNKENKPKKYLTDRRYAQIQNPSEETYARILDSRQQKNPNATQAQIDAYELTLKTTMRAYIQGGEIMYNKDAIQKTFAELSRQLGTALEVDISSEIIDWIPTQFISLQGESKKYSLEEFFTNEVNGLSEQKNKVLKEEYFWALQGMHRHEETHRVLLTLWVHSVPDVPVRTFQPGKSLESCISAKVELSEEDLCRIAEEDFGDAYVWEDGTAQPNIRKYILENGHAVWIDLEQIQPVIQAHITTQLLDQALNDPTKAEVVSKLATDASARFVLMQYGSDGSEITTIPALWAQLAELYDDAEMSLLYEATTPTQRIRLSREALRTDMVPLRTYLDGAEWEVGTLIDQQTKKILTYLDRVQSTIADPTGPTNIDLWYLNDRRDAIRWIGWAQDTLSSLLTRVDSELAILRARLDPTAQDHKLVSDLINDLTLRRENLQRQVDTLVDTTPQSYRTHLQQAQDALDTIHTSHPNNPVPQWLQDDLREATTVLRTHNAGAGARIQWNIQELKNTVALDHPETEEIDPHLESVQLKEFANWFNALQWDGGVMFDAEQWTFSDWALLYFRISGENSQLPGWGNVWIKARILHQPGTAQFMLQPEMCTEFDLPMGRTYGPHDMTADWLDLLKSKRAGGQDIVKARQLDSMTAATQTYLNSEKSMWSVFGKDKMYSSWTRGHVLDDQTRAHIWDLPDRDRPINQIQHLWVPSGEQKYKFLHIDQHGDSVTVRSDDPIRQKKMDYTTFAIFVQDKGLFPFSDAEYKHIQKIHPPADTSTVANPSRLIRLSPASIRQMAKTVREAPQKHLKEKQEMRIKEAEAWMHDKLWWIPGLDGDDAWQTLDAAIFSKISARQKQLAGMDTDDKKWSEKKEWLTQVMADLEDAHKKRGDKEFLRQLAGDYLYVLLEVKEPYEGNLAKYADQWKWVEALLGKEHHTQFMKERQRRYDDLRNAGRDNEDARHRLLNFELEYIADHSKWGNLKHIFGTQFSKSVEDYSEQVETNIDDYAKDAKNRSYSKVLLAVRGKLKKPNGAGFTWFLKVLFEKTEDEDEYLQTSQVVAELFATGTIFNCKKLACEQLAAMGRTYGNPLLKMVNDPNATRKFFNLMDELVPDDRLSKAVWVQHNDEVWLNSYTKKVAYTNDDWEEVQEHVDRRDKTKRRRNRNGNGRKVMNALTFKSGAMFEAIGRLEDIENKDADQEIRLWDLKHFYHERVLGTEWSTLWDSDRAHQSAPMYSEGIMNLTSAGFQSLLYSSLDRTWGWFRKDAKEQNILRWNLLTKIHSLNTQTQNAGKTSKEYLMHFVTTKFLDFFGDDMSSEHKNAFLQALRKGNGALAKRAIYNFAAERRLLLTPIVEKTIIWFGEYFEEHAKTMSLQLNNPTSLMQSVLGNSSVSQSNDPLIKEIKKSYGYGKRKWNNTGPNPYDELYDEVA